MFFVSFDILVFCKSLRKNNSFKVKESTLWEDLDDVIMFNLIKEMTKLEFLWLESKSDWIRI
jgi:hypothetical protein